MDTAVDTALDMPQAEAYRRMQAMDKVVRHFDLGHWAEEVAEQFDAIAARRLQPAASDAA